MKSNTFRLIIIVALMGSLLMTGCKKDQTTSLRLVAEKLSHEDKTFVDRTIVGWVNGDHIRINSTDCTVDAEGNVDQVPADATLYAVYPLSLCNSASGTVSVNLPNTYTYTSNDEGVQILPMPMVGMAQSGASTVNMKHLCSTLQFEISSTVNEAFVLESIELYNSSSPLSGTVSVTINQTDAPTYTVTNGNHRVKMNFGSNDVNARIAGAPLRVQIPVLPVASGTTEVTIRGHMAVSGAILVYENSTTTSLIRAQVHRAPVTIAKPASGNHMRSVNVFRVGTNTYVVFAPGNLQYNPGDGFHFSNNNGTVSSETYYSTPNEIVGYTIDLFGWGAWLPGNNPYNISNDNDTYHWTNNGIIEINGSKWRILSQEEWYYLYHERGDDNYEIINDGIVFYPEYYDESLGTANIYSDWDTYEDAGCIYLPYCGCRDPYVDEETYCYVDLSFSLYWSSTTGTSNFINYGAIAFENGDPGLSNYYFSKGCAVRLVKTVNY